jgi:hypothetical protein
MSTPDAQTPAQSFTGGPSGLASFRLGAAVAERHRLVEIETAATESHHRSANALLQDRYGWRGYHAVSLPAPGSGDSVSLTASHDGEVIGTLTVGFDGARGLNCDATFPDEVHALRERGHQLCEFTKLAIHADDDSTQVLAALFHVAYLVACHLHAADTLLIEVNPRHVRYYVRLLGARIEAAERPNRRVNAPAVLLRIDAQEIRRWIDERPAGEAPSVPSVAGRSLYSRAFSPEEEDAIMARLERQQPATAPRRAPTRPFVFRLPAAQARFAFAP